MKKIYTLFLAVIMGSFAAQATSYTISISGLSYDPATLNAMVGDEITIQATGNHPLRQVSQSSWDANDATQLSGGFGTETTDYTFTITSTDDIYYVCANHVGAGMKGKIVVSPTTGIEETVTVTSLQVYPNPVTNGNLTIKASEQLDGHTLEFYSMNGQLVKTMKLSGLSTKLNVQLPDGVYSAVLVKDDKAVTRKRLVFLN